MSFTFVVPPSLGVAKATARAELLEGALARVLGEPVSVRVASSYAELEAELAVGSAEIAWAPAAVCGALPQVRAIFSVVRHGEASYRSALVVRRDRPVPSLDALAGLRAAWVDARSAGGYLLAAAMLAERGLDPDRLFASQVFVGSHRAAVEAVLHDEADVTAVSVTGVDAESVATRLRWYAGPAGDRLDAIAFTDPAPNDAIVITTAVPPERAAALARKLVLDKAGARGRARLFSALEAEGLIAAELDDYRRRYASLLRAPIAASAPPPRLSQRPPPRSR